MKLAARWTGVVMAIVLMVSAGPARATSAPGWPSGVVGNFAADAQVWAAYRGSPVTVLHAFTDRSSWANIVTPDYIWSNVSGFNGLLVISQPFWPEGSGGSLKECAGGAYDDSWHTFGTELVRAGRAGSVIRPAWEFNGFWNEWSATDVPQWKACFQHVVTSMRAGDPQVRIDWSMNAHGSQTCEGDVWNCYPGDAYVDIIGIDPYDHYTLSPDEAAWTQQCQANEGLCTTIQFARVHNKQFSVGEWSVVTCGGIPGGDNDFYVRKMFETLAANQDILAYDAYYSDPNPDNICSSLNNPDQAPKASAIYRQLWGDGAPATGTVAGVGATATPTAGKETTANKKAKVITSPTVASTPSPTVSPGPASRAGTGSGRTPKTQKRTATLVGVTALGVLGGVLLAASGLLYEPLRRWIGRALRRASVIPSKIRRRWEASRP